jgi:internalin A
MEKFGEPPTLERKHGYSVGRIESNDTATTIRYWPRVAIKDANGWRFERDLKSSILDEHDGGTVPENLSRTHETRLAKRKNVGAPSQRRVTDGTQGRNLSSSRWTWPHDEPQLRAYCEAVSKAHSHIRFVEIPYLKDLSDIELDSLYVEPRLSSHEIHPDTPLNQWPRSFQPIETLRQHPRVVLLGDPGSGKSTLISCLSWQLCRPRPLTPNPWAQEFGGSVPLPMILRELRLKSDLTWEGLLDAFLQHRIGKLLQNRKTVEALLTEGRAVVLLDGLDEIGSVTIRRKLRDAVHTGMATYPNTRWLLTSRIVGYEQVSFHAKIESVSVKSRTTAEVVDETARKKSVRTPMADVLFLAPFNDQQIRSFSINWYTQHEKDIQLIDSQAQEFVEAIQENEGTQRLGRIPYLLTLMALIHHKNARLPHGRTELYERIATAYLESIDLRRQLDQLPYSLAQKKRWLAAVAYKMQLHRARKKVGPSEGDIVVARSQIQQWLREAMAESGASDSKRDSEALLTYFAQRSGLLLPRGEGRFAFMHLSLQEYFAACFLEPKLTASRFSPKQRSEPSNAQLRQWANSEIWTETFILLFELLSEKSLSETEAFLMHLFAKGLITNDPGKVASAAQLLAELAANPFVLLSADTRRHIRQQCWRWLFASRERPRYRNHGGSKIMRTLLQDADGHLGKSWGAAGIAQAELKRLKSLDFSGSPSLVNIDALSMSNTLTTLNLTACAAIRDLKALETMSKLEALLLDGCPNIETLEPLRKLRSLRRLVLGRALNLEPLSGLEGLVQLHIHEPKFEGSSAEPLDLSPLSGLPKFQELCLGGFVHQVKIVVKSNVIAAPAIRRLIESSGGSVTRRLPHHVRKGRESRTLIV